MTKTARLFTRLTVVATLLAATLSATSISLAAASGDPSMLWMAASGSEPSVATNWGRLTLKEGVLAFNSPKAEWQMAVADIKRASVSAQSDRLLVLESVDGDTYYVAILGPNMVVESPRKALQVIRKALPTSASAGSRRER